MDLASTSPVFGPGDLRILRTSRNDNNMKPNIRRRPIYSLVRISWFKHLLHVWTDCCAHTGAVIFQHVSEHAHSPWTTSTISHIDINASTTRRHPHPLISSHLTPVPLSTPPFRDSLSTTASLSPTTTTATMSPTAPAPRTTTSVRGFTPLRSQSRPLAATASSELYPLLVPR